MNHFSEKLLIKKVGFKTLLGNLNIFASGLKGVFAKNERGYRLTAKNDRF